MTSVVFLLSAAILAAERPPPECLLVASSDGNHVWISAGLSPDGEWIAAVRYPKPVRRGHTQTEKFHVVALWKVADLDEGRQLAGKVSSESLKNVSAGSSAANPAATSSAELNGCHNPSRVCFSREGQVVVLAKEGQPGGYLIGKPDRPTPVTAEEADQAKAAGRRVTPFRRSVILFFDRDGLVEHHRWCDPNWASHGNLDHNLFWYPAATAVVHHTRRAVRLLDESTGEEFERLTFDRDKRDKNLELMVGTCDVRITPVDGKCLILATGGQQLSTGSGQRHAIWRLDEDRKVTKIVEARQPQSWQVRTGGISPIGGVFALGGVSADFARNWPRPGPGDPSQGGLALDLWQVEARKTTKGLIGHEHAVMDLDFSPDGKRLATVSFDMTMIVWDVARGEPLARRSLEGVPSYVQFAPDGDHVLTMTGAAGQTGVGTRIILWSVEGMLAADKSSPKRPKL